MRSVKLSIVASLVMVFGGSGIVPAMASAYQTSQAESSSFCSAATKGLGTYLAANYAMFGVRLFWSDFVGDARRS